MKKKREKGQLSSSGLFWSQLPVPQRPQSPIGSYCCCYFRLCTPLVSGQPVCSSQDPTVLLGFLLVSGLSQAVHLIHNISKGRGCPPPVLLTWVRMVLDREWVSPSPPGQLTQQSFLSLLHNTQSIAFIRMLLIFIYNIHEFVYYPFVLFSLHLFNLRFAEL